MTTSVRRLFTWIDVDDRFADFAVRGEWPDWLSEASAYWETLDLTVNRVIETSEIADWLTERFGPGSVRLSSSGEPLLRLESVLEAAPRELAVQVSVGDDRRVRRSPLWRRTLANRDTAKSLPVSDRRLPVPIFAFHSYKGGVGRTTHAMAAALSVADRGERVLLVDGDLEAPGLSWMFRDDGRDSDFAYEDFLALLQSSPTDDPRIAVDLAKSFVPNQEIDGVLFMPARRDLLAMTPPRVAPADLLVPSRPVYHLTDSIGALAVALGVSAVVLDLRAGASEFSSQVLLDPRVTRIFVTSASAQSLEGTRVVLQEVLRLAPAATEESPFPVLVLTQYRDSMSTDALAKMVEPLVNLMVGTGEPSDSVKDGSNEAESILLEFGRDPIFSRFVESLLQLPRSWDAVATVVREANLVSLIGPVIEVSQSELDNPVDLPMELASPSSSIAERRRQLFEFAQPLTYAESTKTQEFLVTDALQELVASHRTVLPVAVVSGAKGAGKTFTQLQMVYRGSWREYAAATEVKDVVVDARIVPVLTSRNLETAAEARVNELRDVAAEREVNFSRIEFSDAIGDALGTTLSDREWRQLWVWGLARSVGLEVKPADAEAAIVEAAASGSRWVFVLDGLEDLLQNIAVDKTQQQALRVLLTDCLEWVKSIRSQPFGLVVFVRRDLVRSALPQNSAQFLNRYSNYQLLWNEDEAIRLAAWVSVRSGAYGAGVDGVQKLYSDKLTEFMLPVWGEKMGTPRSREARSRAWFLAALSDFNGGIQARDIVLFLAEAAEKSVSDERWTDRLLTPVAMRNALIACSEQKIQAIGEETPLIREIFARLRGLNAEQRQVPFTRDAVELTSTDIDLLEQNGVVYREENQYWIPEIFRHGLDFRASGRPRVVSVANLVRKRNNSD